MNHHQNISPRNRVSRRILFGAVGLFIGLAPSSQAVPVTVEQIGITPSELVWIDVTGFRSGKEHAGMNRLLVNGTLENGFCIDPFHSNIGGPQLYDMVPLTSAPKDDHLIAGTHMTASEAQTICQLWALAYPLIASNPRMAAALQIAIWEVIGGNQFHFKMKKKTKDFGAGLLLSKVQAPNYNGPSANLVALTGPGQDFVISVSSPPESVPDNGATITLFGLALAVLAGIKRLSNFPSKSGFRYPSSIK
jgi:hypothetical protein